MSFDFTDKTALITGANRGLGRALIDALQPLALRQIYASYRTDPGDLFELAGVTPVPLDLTHSHSIQTLARQLPELDLLVHNAGVVSAHKFSDLQALTAAETEMATHYFGPLELTQQLLPALQRSSGAAVVGINSIAGLCNYPTIATYSASKAAGHSLLQGLRAEFSRQGITVLGVYPGPMTTRMTAGSALETTPPERVATAILDALRQGIDLLFPDPFARQVQQALAQDPDGLARQFATSLG